MFHTSRLLQRCLLFPFCSLFLLFACQGVGITEIPSPTAVIHTPTPTTPPSSATLVPSLTPVEVEAAENESPLTLRVAAVADEYRNDPQDPGRLTIGQGPVNANITETLTYMDADYQLQPLLAERWEYNPATETWRFYLRQGVTFHDGQPFTAEAVVETLSRVSQGLWGPRILTMDEDSAGVVDDYTVDITPVNRNLSLPELLAHPIFGIRAPGSDPLIGEHIGTGAYIFVEYVNDHHITVRRNPAYWGKPAQVEQIEFLFIPDPNARVLALQTGEVDIAYNIPREAANEVLETPGLQILPTVAGAYQLLGVLITGEEPYTIAQDVSVREAIGYAINRQALIDDIYGGFAVASQTFVPQAILGGYASQIDGYTYDPARAKMLLEEAGWTDTDGDGIREKDDRSLILELVSGFPTGPENGQAPASLQTQLREIGVELVISLMPDRPAYGNRLGNKQGDLFLEIGNQNNASPCFLPTYLYFSRVDLPHIWQLGFAPGPAGWPTFDDEIERCNNSSSSDEAAQHAANALHILIDEARTVIPLVAIYNIWAARDDLVDFEPHPVFTHVRWNEVSINGLQR